MINGHNPKATPPSAPTFAKRFSFPVLVMFQITVSPVLLHKPVSWYVGIVQTIGMHFAQTYNKHALGKAIHKFAP